MAAGATSQPAEPPNFERSLARLDEIVRLLEEGQLGLDEALARYEEGVRLLRQGYRLLDEAERRIELLSGLDAEGRPVTRPLEDVSTLPPEA
jgi:exodeoxyribonuclease VII small subunit